MSRTWTSKLFHPRPEIPKHGKPLNPKPQSPEPKISQPKAPKPSRPDLNLIQGPLDLLGTTSFLGVPCQSYVCSIAQYPLVECSSWFLIKAKTQCHLSPSAPSILYLCVGPYDKHRYRNYRDPANQSCSVVRCLKLRGFRS